jgi:hypothetical protein
LFVFVFVAAIWIILQAYNLDCIIFQSVVNTFLVIVISLLLVSLHTKTCSGVICPYYPGNDIDQATFSKFW